MSIRLVVTRGFGNGIFSGSIKDVVTRGFTIGIQISAIGYLVGETLVFSAYNITSSVESALNGTVSIESALNTKTRTL